MNANRQLDEDLATLAATLPGTLVHLNVSLSDSFEPRRCVATFSTADGDYPVEIPLQPGFCLSAWLAEREQAPPAGTLH